MARVDELIRRLSLKPLAKEGGFFRFLHLFGNEAGAIYYLITKDSFSSLHLLSSDEVWFFLEGGRCEQVTLVDGGSLKRRIIDCDNRTSMIKAGEWQATKLIDGDYALFSTVKSPHYVDSDYNEPTEKLLDKYPDLREYLL